jgi:hypothetical protein
MRGRAFPRSSGRPFVEQTDFAVDDKRAAQFPELRDNLWIPRRRVFPVTRQEFRLARQDAVTVVFEFEYPAGSRERRMIRRE